LTAAVQQVTVVLTTLDQALAHSPVLCNRAIRPTLPIRHPPGAAETPATTMVGVVQRPKISFQTRLKLPHVCFVLRHHVIHRPTRHGSILKPKHQRIPTTQVEYIIRMKSALRSEPIPMSRLILAFTEDIMLLPRLQDVAQSHGFKLHVISQAADLGIEGDPRPKTLSLTEPLEGPAALLMRKVSALQPGLILFDLTFTKLPWAAYIQVLKTSAATRRVPILAFGPHVEEQRFEQARKMGADIVISRGSFHKRMAVLFIETCLPDRGPALEQACSGQLSKKARRGIELHNQGEFYEAHELLEHAWMEAPEAEGSLYRALLQFTVAYLHIERGNPRGARKMMLRIHQWLDPLPDACRGVDVSALRSAVKQLRSELESSSLKLDLHPQRIQLVS
jgi:predicted metal-dependent hydrolase